MLKSLVKCEKCDFSIKINSEKIRHKSKVRCPKCKNILIFRKNISLRILLEKYLLTTVN